MYPTIDDKVARNAALYLARHDPKLAQVIKRVGPASFRPHKDYYWELVGGIISQQLSVKAANSIERRFKDLFDGSLPSPAQILDKDGEALRGAGLSRPKATYIRDLAQHITEGKISFDKFDHLSNTEIQNALIDVKGIGEWTVHMFLIFCMGRLNVLPVGDLGIRNGIRSLYGFSSQPGPEDIRRVAEENSWAPFTSIASWYVWQSLK